MHRLCTVSSTNPRSTPYARRLFSLNFNLYAHIVFGGLILLFTCGHPQVACSQQRDEPIEMGVVVVNPSATKVQTIPIKMYLPQEVTPDAILDSDGLSVEFDSEKSMYYVFKDDVILKPSETKNFNVEIKDVWIIPQGRLDSLNDQAQAVISRLVGSEFHESAVLLGNAIAESIDAIVKTQYDTAVSRRSHIGIYRNNLQIVEQVKEDIERLEKQLEIVSSLPKPEVLENAELKTDSPEESTSWMIIFIIMLFIGMLAGVFFFTWQTQAHATKDLISDAREAAFPEGENSDDEEK